MQTLNEYDIELLMDALDAFQKSDLADVLMMSMLDSAVSSQDERAKAESEHRLEKRLSDAKTKSKAKAERIILLKAKLIQMRDSQAVESLAAEFESDAKR